MSTAQFFFKEIGNNRDHAQVLLVVIHLIKDKLTGFLMELQLNVNLVYSVRTYLTIKLRDCFSFCAYYRYCSLYRQDRHFVFGKKTRMALAL